MSQDSFPRAVRYVAHRLYGSSKAIKANKACGIDRGMRKNNHAQDLVRVPSVWCLAKNCVPRGGREKLFAIKHACLHVPFLCQKYVQVVKVSRKVLPPAMHVFVFVIGTSPVEPPCCRDRGPSLLVDSGTAIPNWGIVHRLSAQTNV